jgi:hypothetical protein
MTSPDGDSAVSIQMMQEKTQAWINAVRNGHLHHRNVWFLLKVQFWPRIGYGLCSLMAMFHNLEYALHRQYYKMLPFMQSPPVNTGGELFNGCRILWCRSATSRSGSSYHYVKQTLDALWMQHSNREIHENIIFPILSRTRALVPADAGIIPKVQYPCHSFVDEDVMGKNFDV